MKRAKILLSAFAVMAVVGGALAFKAKTFSASVYCSTQSGGTCQEFKKSTYTENPSGVSFCTTSSVAQACTIQSDAPVVNE